MRYYEINFNNLSKNEEEQEEVIKKCKEYSFENDNFCGWPMSLQRNATCIFVSDEKISDPESKIKDFITNVGLDVCDYSYNEIGLRDVSSKIRRRFLYDELPDYVGERFKSRVIDYDFNEYIVDPKSNNTAQLKKYAKLTCMPDLYDEACRIRESRTKKFYGHPVHYIIEDDGFPDIQKRIFLLIGALKENNRLESLRVLGIDELVAGSRDATEAIDDIYKNIKKGTLIVSNHNLNLRKSCEDIIGQVCMHAGRYANEVLTIFCIEKNDDVSRKKIESMLGNSMSFVTISDRPFNKKEASSYFKRLAKEKGFIDVKSVIGGLESEREYTKAELDSMFEKKYSEYIRTEYFPSYKNVLSGDSDIIVENAGMNKLEDMIGLSKIKDLIGKTVSYYKVLGEYDKRGISFGNMARSMVFTGNPGTAKTTVARLVGEIFKENGILEKGEFIEVCRADLIGKYVGHTAPLVKDAFKMAKGSILFIDEAYSLVDHHANSYGDEAINTIVEEMENHREDTIVIFAGYPDQMKLFLERNPGLKSRIAFHVDFPDYNVDELLAIFEHMAKEKSLVISDEAKIKSMEIFEKVAHKNDFGNGRFVRNLLEQSIMNMVTRLSLEGVNKMSDECLTTVLPEDIWEPEYVKEVEEKIRIGFVGKDYKT